LLIGLLKPREAVMEFYIMDGGYPQKIPDSERRYHATFYGLDNKTAPAVLTDKVKFIGGPPADDTKLSEVESGREQTIKVSGHHRLKGRPIEVEEIRRWQQKGDWYLKTEIVPGAYCYSWIAGDSDEEAVCISFEIIREGEEKK